jgi:2'-5' RNA ligase
MARVFIGIFAPENMKYSISTLQKKLKAFPIECKLVEKENLHISLDFIGEVGEEELDEIKAKISELVKTVSPFEVEIAGLKLIPNDRFVRVIALDAISNELFALGKKIMNSIGGDAKPPHLTLCRVKKVLSKDELSKKFDEIKNEKIGSFAVSSIQLIKSELRGDGPVYSVVSDFSFG